MTNGQWPVVQIFLWSAVIHLSLTVLLIPSHGALGAAIATVVGVVFSQAAMVWRVRQALGVDATAVGLGVADARVSC